MWSDAGLAAATVAFPFILTISFTPRSFNVAPWHHCRAVPLNFSIDSYLMMRCGRFWQLLFASIRNTSVDKRFCPVGNAASPTGKLALGFQVKASGASIFCDASQSCAVPTTLRVVLQLTNRLPPIWRKAWLLAQFFG
jgi:hypothetical protein